MAYVPRPKKEKVRNEAYYTQRMATVDMLADLAEKMVLPVERKNAQCLIGLVLHYLDEHWANSENFMEGAKTVWKIVHTNRADACGTEWYKIKEYSRRNPILEDEEISAVLDAEITAELIEEELLEG